MFLKSYLPYRIHVLWDIHDLAVDILSKGFDSKIVVKMSKVWFSEQLLNSCIFGGDQTFVQIRNHPLLPDLVEQGVVALLRVIQVLVGGPLHQGHLVVGVEERHQGVEWWDILLDREVGDDPGLPVPEDKAAKHKDGDEDDSDRNGNRCYTPPGNNVVL